MFNIYLKIAVKIKWIKKPEINLSHYKTFRSARLLNFNSASASSTRTSSLIDQKSGKASMLLEMCIQIMKNCCLYVYVVILDV